MDGAATSESTTPASRPSVRISEDDLTGAEVRGLLAIHAAGMLANSPPGACHFLDVDALRLPDVTFWSAWDADRLAGCGALREIGPLDGEVKSMRTAESYLGRGVGAALLTHIVDESRRRGYSTLSLETGSTPAFTAAIGLYERFGFERCGPFGGYEPNEFNRFYTLAL